MAGKRPGPPAPWREWLWSLLLGVGLAVFCIALLSRCQAGQIPATQSASTKATATQAQRSVGVEFSFGVHILLPNDKGG